MPPPIAPLNGKTPARAGVRTSGTCRHCLKSVSFLRRGLCSACYRQPELREVYPPHPLEDGKAPPRPRDRADDDPEPDQDEPAERTTGTCSHCKSELAFLRRGLCRTCWNKPGVKEQYQRKASARIWGWKVEEEPAPDPPEKKRRAPRLENDPDKYIRVVKGGRYQARPCDLGVRYDLGLFPTRDAARVALAEFWRGLKHSLPRHTKQIHTRDGVKFAAIPPSPIPGLKRMAIGLFDSRPDAAIAIQVWAAKIVANFERWKRTVLTKERPSMSQAAIERKLRAAAQAAKDNEEAERIARKEARLREAEEGKVRSRAAQATQRKMIEQRRERVKSMTEEGKTRREIMQELGLPANTLHNDLAAIRGSGQPTAKAATTKRAM